MGAPRCPSRSRGECPTASLPQDFGVRCRPRTAPSGAPLCRPLRDRREGPRGTLCTPGRPQRRPASSPIPQPGAGRRLSWAGQRRRVPPLAALPLSGWGRPGRLSPGSHFSSLGAWWRRERGRVSPAGRGPEAAAGAERSRSAQEAPGSGHCSQEDPVPPLENAQVFSCVKCWLKSHRFNSLEREHPKAIQVQVELIQGIARLLKWLTKAKNRGHWCVMSSSGQSPRPSPPVRSVMCQYEQ
ncbi:LHFPL tetraspan subfamily member 2 protein isoform X1 [Gallus gallus]|uniref:LHFPL tetraspan subfamily member 2 protein isoform X1 n=1 Tax=Gallus gallus TaxID=9031 RepID=UPI001AE90B97|nr:LHFPL tetraspan subfamily member 2 protein isoform X1 [Gallus gallus]XP_046792439.1 LHFPL tetraspan subfamily member 2 protein isoform X1 [Gallus gallus]